jgi:membrane fusion protein, heavy metal efflux system
MGANTPIAAILLLVTACGRSPAVGTGQAPACSSASSSHDKALIVDAKLLTSGRISISTAEEKSLTDEVWVSGQIVAAPRGKAEIGALMTSRVRSVAVQEGDVVRVGQVLATLDAPDAARIFGDLAAARARRARAETVLAQELALAEQRATSARSVSDATSDADSARADELTATLLLQTYNAKGTVLTVKTPIAGIVAHHRVQIGAQVDSGDVLFKIVDPSKLNVRADVPEALAETIRVGSAAQLRFSASGRTCDSGVVSSTRSVDPIKRTVSFRLQPTGVCDGLLEGGFVDVRLALKPCDNAAGDAGVAPRYVAVPRSAIVEIDGVPVAFRTTDVVGQFRLTTVSVARNTDSTAFIEKGLASGDQVAATGALLLKGEWLRSRLE